MQEADGCLVWLTVAFSEKNDMRRCRVQGKGQQSVANVAALSKWTGAPRKSGIVADSSGVLPRIGGRLTDIVRTPPQAAQALQNVDNSLELACQWLLAAAAREDGDDAEPSGAQVRLPDISH